MLDPIFTLIAFRDACEGFPLGSSLLVHSTHSSWKELCKGWVRAHS